MVNHGDLEAAGPHELEAYIPVKLTKDIISRVTCMPDVMVKVDRTDRTYHGKGCIFGIARTKSTIHRVSGVIRIHFNSGTTNELDRNIKTVKEEMIKRKLTAEPMECKWISAKSKHKKTRLKGYLTYPDDPGIRRAVLTSTPAYSYYIFKDGKCLNVKRE